MSNVRGELFRFGFVLSFFIAAGCFLSAWAQSTYGTVLGTVKDPQGNVVVLAKVQMTNKGTNKSRSVVTSADGLFELSNVEAGAYELMVEAPGFQTTKFSAFDLGARETKRVDVDLKIATQSEMVNVESSVNVVQTDTSNIAETKSGRELVDLPVAIGARSTGSTSPISTLTTQPGVQIDSTGYISVGGATPTMLSLSIDGVSVIGARAGESGPINELFPSFNAISEIRVSETINPAEFGGVADITTITSPERTRITAACLRISRTAR